MTKVLLVYVLAPEAVKIYDLEVDDADFANLSKCHNKFGNCVGLTDEEERLTSEWLPGFLNGKDPILEDNQDLPFGFLAGGRHIMMTGFVL